MFERIKGLFKPTRKAGGDLSWFNQYLTQAQETDGSLKVHDPYKVHAWINIGVSTIARNIARADFKIYQGDKEAADNRVKKLFDFVNPYLSKYQLWEATVSWKRIKGEAFWYVDGSVGVPDQIVILNPANMHHVVKNKEVLSWTYQDSSNAIPFSLDEIIHFRVWNPWNKWRGVSEFIPISSEISQDVAANKYNNNLLNNRSIPDGVLSIPEMVSVDDAERIETAWNKAHKGAMKAHKIAVLGGGATFIPTSMSPNDMKYLDIKAYDRTTILAKLGVPPQIVGVFEGGTPLSGSQVKETMEQFWNLTLIPEICSIEDKLKTDFFQRYRLNLVGRFDLTEIPELQEDEAKKMERVRADVTAGIVTINEARDEMDKDPLAWGDSWWISMAMRPAAETVEPPPPVDNTPVEEMFPKEKEIKFPAYTDDYKKVHLEKVMMQWDNIEKMYTKELKAWMFKQRAYFLEELNREEKTTDYLLNLIDSDEYWDGQNKILEKIAEKNYILAMNASAVEVVALMNDIGVEVAADWSIYNTRAPMMLNHRVDKVTAVTDTIRKRMSTDIRGVLQTAVTEGYTPQQINTALSESIRDSANVNQNRAATISRTELGGAFNDSRMESFVDLGVTKHEWSHSSVGDDDRPTHVASDGEIRHIGETFPSGLIYPHDLAGAAGDVINCNCLTYPVVED